MPILYFIPSPGRFLAGRVTCIRRPTLAHLRAFVRIEPLAWVIA
jgi:hypothetical protein